MLPRLERLLDTRVDAQGALMALEVAATCMLAACCNVQRLSWDEMHKPRLKSRLYPLCLHPPLQGFYTGVYK